MNLNTASLAIRKSAALLGIKSGQWEPISADRSIDALPDDAPVAKVWNSRKEITITAGHVRYAHEYL